MERAFDWIIIFLLVLFIVMFALGKGNALLDFFSGSHADEYDKLYDRDKMNKATLIFCIILLIAELLQAFILPGVRIVSLVCLIVSVAAFVVYIVYMQKIRNDRN